MLRAQMPPASCSNVHSTSCLAHVRHSLLSFEIGIRILEISRPTPPNAAAPVPFWARRLRLTDNRPACITRECLWFHVGYPGKTGDARVFHETGVGAFVASLPPDNHLIGDGAFILSKGLMKPFAFENASPAHEYFNFKLSSSRMVIECFFGQLKSRFRCLLDGLKFRSMSTNCLVISSCAVLHNFILSNSSSDEQLFFDNDLLDNDELHNWMSDDLESGDSGDQDRLGDDPAGGGGGAKGYFVVFYEMP